MAGEDGQFHAAKARVAGTTVRLRSDKVVAPKKVRFAWANTATPNLYNGAGMPTSTFLSQ
jgi:sialate O-acetylesterase